MRLSLMDFMNTWINFLFQYIDLISVFVSQMAQLGFNFTSLLSLSEQVTLWLRIIPVQSEREREKKKENSPEKNTLP